VKEPPENKPPAAEKDPPTKKPPVKERKQISAHLEQHRQIDDLERFLVLLLLRRYVTYCTRRRRLRQIYGAAQLHRKLAAVM